MPERPSDAQTGKFSVGDTVETTAGREIRVRPGSMSEVVRLLPSGTRAIVLEGPVLSGNLPWWHVSVDDERGWVEDDALRSSDEFQVGAKVVTTSALNLRSEPGTAHTVLFLLPAGTHLEVLHGPVMNNGYQWYHVEAGKYGSGWLVSEWLREI